MLQYIPSIRALVGCFLHGVSDSLRVPSTLVFFLSSVTVRVRAAHCLLLNGLIFLGSIVLADYVMAPALRSILLWSGASSETDTPPSLDRMPLASASLPLPSSEHSLATLLNVIFLYAYQLLWVYPLYAISFILNAIWYQDIADHAFITHGGTTGSGAPGVGGKTGVTFQKWVATMSDEVYRLLLVTAFMGQITLVSFVPYIGNALVVVHLCWLYSLYSFEYKWSLLGWSLEYRLKYFERHWAYFLGFGLPAVTLSLVFPKFISLGIFALAFPMFIILAIIAHPTTHVPKSRKDSAAVVDPSRNGRPSSTSSSPTPASAPVLLAHVPIFRGATWLNWWLLQRLQTRNRGAAASEAAARRSTAAKAAASSAGPVDSR